MITPEQRERLSDLSDEIIPVHYLYDVDRAAIRAALERIGELEKFLEWLPVPKVMDPAVVCEGAEALLGKGKT